MESWFSQLKKEAPPSKSKVISFSLYKEYEIDTARSDNLKISLSHNDMSAIPTK
jgi:hypothetical protein